MLLLLKNNDFVKLSNPKSTKKDKKDNKKLCYVIAEMKLWVKDRDLRSQTEITDTNNNKYYFMSKTELIFSDFSVVFFPWHIFL